MPYLAGIVLALTVSGLANLVGLDRDRAFYPTVLVVIASYYVLFAVMGGSGHALVGDCRDDRISAGCRDRLQEESLVGCRCSRRPRRL